MHEFLKRQNDTGQKIILPLLHGVSQEQLEIEYPQLADIQCLITENHTNENIAVLFAKELIKRLKGNAPLVIVSPTLSDKMERSELKEEVLKVVNIEKIVKTSTIAKKLGIEEKLAFELLRELCMHDRAISSGGPIKEDDFDRNVWTKKK